MLTRAQPVPPFEEVAAFIEANPDWPGGDTLRRRAEAAMGDAIAPARVFAWFTAHPPISGVGKMRLAEAQIAAGDDTAATTLLRDAWINDDFAYREERTFYARHRKRLTRADHVARLDRLQWDGKRGAARRMLRRVGEDHRALAEARDALKARAGGVDGAIARVPDALRDHPGLWYERLRWRRRKGLHDSAREILAALPADLVRPEAWWRETHIETRKAIEEGLISVAYRLASGHRQTTALASSEAEWLAGWIALRFLEEPDLAYPHFALLHTAVRYPISVARGAYWAGRAAAAAGHPEVVRHWFDLAADHPTTFYGQLARTALGGRGLLELPPDPAVSGADRAAIEKHELAPVVHALAATGQDDLLRPFVLRLADLASTPGQRRLVAELVAGAGRPAFAVTVARRTARRGTTLIELGYPVIALPPVTTAGGGADEALVLAMLRQESGFDQAAVSRAGALGLMQLMPTTARAVARRLGLPYDKERLTGDRDYNLTLGRAYIAQLLDAYDGSYLLALAAYNAGGRRVRRWIHAYGDPRGGEVDPVDWIELIPISETRNYVQRVMEAVPVYRQRLGRPAPAHGLLLDLRRGMTPS